MGTFRKRKITLKIRKIKETMEYANKECKREINKLNNSDNVPSCSHCKSNEHVKCVGSNKGTKKFRCDCPAHHKQPVALMLLVLTTFILRNTITSLANEDKVFFDKLVPVNARDILKLFKVCKTLTAE